MAQGHPWETLLKLVPWDKAWQVSLDGVVSFLVMKIDMLLISYHLSKKHLSSLSFLVSVGTLKVSALTISNLLAAVYIAQAGF